MFCFCFYFIFCQTQGILRCFGNQGNKLQKQNTKTKLLNNVVISIKFCVVMSHISLLLFPFCNFTAVLLL